MGATIFNTFRKRRFSFRKKYYVNVYALLGDGQTFGQPCLTRRAADREAEEGKHRFVVKGPRLYVVAVYRKPSDVFERHIQECDKEHRWLRQQNAASPTAWPHPYPPRN